MGPLREWGFPRWPMFLEQDGRITGSHLWAVWEKLLCTHFPNYVLQSSGVLGDREVFCEQTSMKVVDHYTLLWRDFSHLSAYWRLWEVYNTELCLIFFHWVYSKLISPWSTSPSVHTQTSSPEHKLGNAAPRLSVAFSSQTWLRRVYETFLYQVITNSKLFLCFFLCSKIISEWLRKRLRFLISIIRNFSGQKRNPRDGFIFTN